MRRTIVDVARAAGVSTATVDRVLNGRDGVRALTRDRVIAAARETGYLAVASAAVPTRERLQLDFVLQSGPNTFMDLLAGHLAGVGAARAAEADVRVHRVDGFSPEILAATLRELRPASAGVGIIALDHPIVREAIREAAANGLPVLTMVSDVANVPRVGYVGIDNRAAGRLAGHLLGRFVPGSAGEVALFAGSLRYRGHEEREMGFRHILADEFPKLRIVELREVRDDLERGYDEAKGLLAAHPGLRGIYSIGAGNHGIARALEEAGRGGEVVFIGHEITEHTRRFLLAGTMDAVIDQNPRVEAREAVDRLLRAARGQPDPDPAAVRIHAIFRENIPEV
ncbi:MAG TPA: LacI family DNA-binding transcriptional regulator [Geminicoccaceae bacterium]|nr:LacI family DNA-binding transcriptional regulator [Geminicoccaceae bacterium]